MRGIPALGILGEALELPDIPLPRACALQRQADDWLRLIGGSFGLGLMRRHRPKLRRRLSGLRCGGQRLGGQYMVTVATSYAAQVLVWRGQVAEAASRLERFLPLAREIRDPQVLMPALAIAAVIRQAEGDEGQAMALVEELAELVLNAEYAFFNFFHLTDVARICASAGRLEVVERLLERLEPGAAREHHGVLTARAELAGANSAIEEAAELYGQAAEAWRGFPSVLEEGLALMGAGRCRLALSQEAGDELRRAREVLLGLGARRPLDEADDLLRQSMAQTS